jgi:hypothetical protein
MRIPSWPVAINEKQKETLQIDIAYTAAHAHNAAGALNSNPIKSLECHNDTNR